MTRFFDERSHSYMGYSLRVQGTIGGEEREFLVGVGKAAHAKHQFRAGDVVSGKAQPVADEKIEPVEMIIDQWNPSQKRHRFETFCYGPKSFSQYRAGPTRKVPGRRGMVWEEEDWVDEDATAHRGEDD